MSEEEEFIPEAARPYIEDLLDLGWKYNIYPRDVEKAIDVVEKASSSKNYADALLALKIAISNASSPPVYVSPIPVDSEVVSIMVLRPEHLKHYTFIKKRSKTRTYCVVILYRPIGSNEIEMVGWKLHYNSFVGRFFTEPMFIHELEALKEALSVEKTSEAEAETAEEESYSE